MKSVAGYDLPKLFTGAHGRLGQIRELTLRLHPLPRDRDGGVRRRSIRWRSSRSLPACVEYAWPPGQMLVRFESPVASALGRAARPALGGGELISDDEELWADHREAAAASCSRRVLPADVPAEIERLRACRVRLRIARPGRPWAALQRCGDDRRSRRSDPLWSSA